MRALAAIALLLAGAACGDYKVVKAQGGPALADPAAALLVADATPPVASAAEVRLEVRLVAGAVPKAPVWPPSGGCAVAGLAVRDAGYQRSFEEILLEPLLGFPGGMRLKGAGATVSGFSGLLALAWDDQLGAWQAAAPGPVEAGRLYHLDAPSGGGFAGVSFAASTSLQPFALTSPPLDPAGTALLPAGKDVAVAWSPVGEQVPVFVGFVLGNTIARCQTGDAAGTFTIPAAYFANAPRGVPGLLLVAKMARDEGGSPYHVAVVARLAAAPIEIP